jgi:hypothetical protein
MAHNHICLGSFGDMAPRISEVRNRQRDPKIFPVCLIASPAMDGAPNRIVMFNARAAVRFENEIKFARYGTGRSPAYLTAPTAGRDFY